MVQSVLQHGADPCDSAWHDGRVGETTPACDECEGHGGAAMEWHDDLDITHSDWVPCSACNGTGVGETTPEPAPTKRVWQDRNNPQQTSNVVPSWQRTACPTCSSTDRAKRRLFTPAEGLVAIDCVPGYDPRVRCRDAWHGGETPE